MLTWSDDRVEQLKKLWEAGLSCSQIAADLGHVTRNAVIGKVHRLGLSGRAKTSSSATPRPRKARLPMHFKPRISKASKALAEFLDVDLDPLSECKPIESSHRISLNELNDSNCHWPIGSPGAEDFAFCGNHSLSGLPYCPGHCRIAYRPGADRRPHLHA